MKGNDNVCDDKGPSADLPSFGKRYDDGVVGVTKYPDSPPPLPYNIRMTSGPCLLFPQTLTTTKTRTYYVCLAKSRGGERCRYKESDQVGLNECGESIRCCW